VLCKGRGKIILLLLKEHSVIEIKEIVAFLTTVLKSKFPSGWDNNFRKQKTRWPYHGM